MKKEILKWSKAFGITSTIFGIGFGIFLLVTKVPFEILVIVGGAIIFVAFVWYIKESFF